VKEYTLLRDSFIKLLFLATYLFIGSPTRGTELKVIRYINSIEYPRNIYLDPSTNLVLLNLVYSKTRDITKVSNKNIRILPPALSRVYLYYLILVVPFFNYIKRRYYSIKEISPYIFEINNTELDSALLSSLLAKESEKALELEKGLTLSPFRDLLIYIISSRITDRTLFTLTSSTSKDYTKDPIEDILANHAFNTRETTYGRTTDLFTNTTRSILYRSKELSYLYFSFFKLDITRELIDILDSLSLETPKLVKKLDLESRLEKERLSTPSSITLTSTRERRLSSNPSLYTYKEDSSENYLEDSSDNSLEDSSSLSLEKEEEEEEEDEEVVPGPSNSRSLTRANLTVQDLEIFNKFAYLDNLENLDKESSIEEEEEDNLLEEEEEEEEDR
jgi:hypothetical protein